MEKHTRFDDSDVADREDDFDPPIGGPGMFEAVGQPIQVPPRHPDYFVCLRGPCRHYWHLVTMANIGNPAETFEALGIPVPRKHNHVCLVNPGMETTIGNDNVFECSRWEPQSTSDLIQIRVRREAYFDKHPEHAPAPPATEEEE